MEETSTARSGVVPVAASGVERTPHPLDVRRAVGLLGPRPRGERDDQVAGSKVGQGRGLARQVDGEAAQRSGHAVGVAPQREHVVPAARRGAGRPPIRGLRSRRAARPRSRPNRSPRLARPWTWTRAASVDRGPMTRTLHVDYLVVGAGAAGMAFTDALIDHADVRVALVDRRHGVGGHWLEAYPFVRLHQSSAFYGVASTLLGGGQLQQGGPEAGLQERASQPEIVSLLRTGARPDAGDGPGRVPPHQRLRRRPHRRLAHLGGGVRGPRVVPDRRRPLPRAQHPGGDAAAVRRRPTGPTCCPVNDLVRLEEAPSQYVVVGSGKTATDACVWLLAGGVDPDAICWVRPRDPWMFDRALHPARPRDLHRLRRRPHAVGRRGGLAGAPVPPAGGRRDRDAHRPLGDAHDGQDPHAWVRGSSSSCARSRTSYVAGTSWPWSRGRSGPRRRRRSAIADDAVVVHCAADGLRNPPLVPVWRPGTITLQPIRAGFPELRRGADRVRRGDPRRRRREEPALPALALRQLDGRSGPG